MANSRVAILRLEVSGASKTVYPEYDTFERGMKELNDSKTPDRLRTKLMQFLNYTEYVIQKLTHVIFIFLNLKTTNENIMHILFYVQNFITLAHYSDEFQKSRGSEIIDTINALNS